MSRIRWWWKYVRRKLPRPCPKCGCLVFHDIYWVEWPYAEPKDYGWNCEHEGEHP